MLGPALSPLPTPRPQQPGLNEALMPAQNLGQEVVAQNYNGWRNLLRDPAMTAAMLQYAVSLTGDTGRGTFGDIANAAGQAAGAAGRATTAQVTREQEQEQAQQQQAQQQLENDMNQQRLELEKQRVEIARGAAQRRGSGGGGTKPTDPVKLAEMQWKEAYKAWAAAEPFQGQPDTRGPAPDLNDYIFRQQNIQAAVANGMDYSDYKAAEAVDPALAKRLVTGYAVGADKGKAVIDEFLGEGDPGMDQGLDEPDAEAPAKTPPPPPTTPPPANAYDLPALEPDEPPVRIITQGVPQEEATTTRASQGRARAEQRVQEAAPMIAQELSAAAEQMALQQQQSKGVADPEVQAAVEALKRPEVIAFLAQNPNLWEGAKRAPVMFYMALRRQGVTR